MLDEGSRDELMGILRDMQAEGSYTILLITHDADEILASDRVLALHGVASRQMCHLRSCSVMQSCWRNAICGSLILGSLPVNWRAGELRWMYPPAKRSL